MTQNEVEGLTPAATASRYCLYDRTSGRFVVYAAFLQGAVQLDLPQKVGDRREASALTADSIRRLIPHLRKRFPDADFVGVIAAQPCPHCGRRMDTSDRDFVHPENREKTRWRAGCNLHDFGCGYEVFGSSSREVREKWNSAAEHEASPNALRENGGQP